MPQRAGKSATVLISLVVCWGLWTSSAIAQTLDNLSGVGRMGAVARLSRELQRGIDLRHFPKNQTLKEALITLYQIVSSQGSDLTVIIDVDSIKEACPEVPDVYDQPVHLPSNRRTMTIAAILQCFVKQATHGKGTWFVRPDFVEITCHSRDHRPHRNEVLSQPIDLDGAPASMPFQKMLECLEQQLQARDCRIDLHVDVEALQAAVSPRFDLRKLKIRLPQADPDLTLGEFLQHVLRQIPGSNASLLIVDDCLEVTTARRAEYLRSLLPQLRPSYSDSLLHRTKRGDKAV
jgi:hypothetical protein